MFINQLMCTEVGFKVTISTVVSANISTVVIIRIFSLKTVSYSKLNIQQNTIFIAISVRDPSPICISSFQQ